MRVHTLNLRDKLKATITRLSLYSGIISARKQLMSKAAKLQVREEGGGGETRIAVLFSHTVL